MKTLISGAAVVSQHGSDLYLSRNDTLSLGQWMDAFGFSDCTLILPFHQVSERPTKLDLLDDRWNIIPLMDNDSSSFARKKQAAASLAKLNPASFDFAYCRMPAYEAWWTYRFAHKNGIQIISELHGNWSEAFLAQPATNVAKKVVNHFRAKWSHKAFNEISQNSIGVSCIGPKLKDIYVPDNIPCLVTTNHTVPASKYHERKDFVANQPPRLVFIGELQKRKGLQILFPALQRLKKESIDFKLLIFGNGPQEQMLRTMAKELGIEDNIEFRGYVANGDELFEHLRNADLFVLPSIAAEGVPRAIHEAMAMGCPVVATDIGSTDWQLRGNSGLVVIPNDVNDLATKLKRVLTDTELQKSLSANGTKVARQHSYELQSAGIAEFVAKITAQ